MRPGDVDLTRIDAVVLRRERAKRDLRELSAQFAV
jgi:hypothetical protein